MHMNIEPLYKNTVKVFTFASLVWFLIAVVIGLTFVQPTEAAISIALSGIFMFFVSGWMVRLLLYIQKENPFLTNKKIIDFFSMLLWVFGIIGALFFLLIGLYLYN